MKSQTDPDEVVLAKALRSGTELKEGLILRAGGLVDTETAAGLLDISMQALNERTILQTVIAVAYDGALGYPAFQFESETMRSGVAMVLQVIGVDDPWMRLNFMFLRLDELGGETAVDAIRSGNSAAVAFAARHFGVHGAA